MSDAEFEAHRPDHEHLPQRFQLWQSGPHSALRAYRAFHPGARIYVVEFRGRTVWMTSKQLSIWNACRWFMHRHPKARITLEDIAYRASVSKASASRFVRRLYLWRFIDLASSRGRYGGTYILRRESPYFEEDAWLSGAKQTVESLRKAAEIRWQAFQSIRRRWRQRLGRLPLGHPKVVVRMQH